MSSSCVHEHHSFTTFSTNLLWQTFSALCWTEQCFSVLYGQFVRDTFWIWLKNITKIMTRSKHFFKQVSTKQQQNYSLFLRWNKHEITNMKIIPNIENRRVRCYMSKFYWRADSQSLTLPVFQWYSQGHKRLKYHIRRPWVSESLPLKCWTCSQQPSGGNVPQPDVTWVHQVTRWLKRYYRASCIRLFDWRTLGYHQEMLKATSKVKNRYLTCWSLNILNLCNLPNKYNLNDFWVLLYWYMWLDQSEKRQHIHQLFSVFVLLWATDVLRRLWHWSVLKVLWKCNQKHFGIKFGNKN